MALLLKKGKCKMPFCKVENRIYARGLCLKHYYQLEYAVIIKARRWEEFEDYGLCLPKVKPGKKVRK